MGTTKKMWDQVIFDRTANIQKPGSIICIRYFLCLCEIGKERTIGLL